MHGYTVPIDREFMLIFGGVTARDITFKDDDGNEYDIYNFCERYEELTGNPRNTTYSTCGEELLNDVWIYEVLEGTWTHLKPDVNRDFERYPVYPSARYGHTGTYVELNDTRNYFEGTNIPVLRKYLYVYGGFSFMCQTACFDLWRFEIPFAPMSYYPMNNITEWRNAGNHWKLVNEDENYSPGPRFKHSMITHQSVPKGNSTRSEAYIYIFGGIKVKSQDPDVIIDPNAERDLYASSFEYMGDLWRYNLITDQWENMEVYGIATVWRTLSLWSGEIKRTTVPSEKKLKNDLPNQIPKRIKDLDPKLNETIELPAPRGGHSACIIGNPSDYIMIFGGSTEEVLQESDSNVHKIKKTLDDVWVYNTETYLWSRIFVNSQSPPKRENAIMTTVKSDRLLLLYGGLAGQTLF